MEKAAIAVFFSLIHLITIGPGRTEKKAEEEKTSAGKENFHLLISDAQPRQLSLGEITNIECRNDLHIEGIVHSPRNFEY